MGRTLLLAFGSMIAVVVPQAHAQGVAPPPDLLARLAVHAAGVEAMRTRASYALDGEMDRLDGDGKVDGTKELHARIEADGAAAHMRVLRYVEDGEDKTGEARDKARERDAEKPDEKKKHEIRMPFLVTEQPRYVFEQLETDAAAPTHVRIAFVPRAPAEDTIEGSAWVDTRSGTVLSAGFKVSKTTTFVDYMHATVEFGAPTALGPAVSRVTVEGKGGFLFFRKRFRANATLSDYTIVGAGPR